MKPKNFMCFCKEALEVQYAEKLMRKHLFKICIISTNDPMFGKGVLADKINIDFIQSKDFHTHFHILTLARMGLKFEK